MTIPNVIRNFEFLVTHLWIFLHHHDLHAFRGPRSLLRALRAAVDALWNYWLSHL